VNLLLPKLQMVLLEKRAYKIMQFAIMLHLLQQGHPMLEYEALKLLKGEIVAPKYYCPSGVGPRGKVNILLIHKRIFTNLFYYIYSSNK
jgi:hypothetical protein